MSVLGAPVHDVDDPDASAVLCWTPAEAVRVAASGPLGGGIGDRRWVINATVRSDYVRTDPDRHLADLAARLGLTGPGVGMLTAVQVARACRASDGDADVVATVGLTWPTRAAAPDDDPNPYAVSGPGTVNLIAWVPVALGDAALVGAVITVTEAKAQALAAAGIPGTGTASDAVCIACPRASGEMPEPFAGPRSTWGARLARATYAAVTAGIERGTD